MSLRSSNGSIENEKRAEITHQDTVSANPDLAARVDDDFLRSMGLDREDFEVMVEDAKRAIDEEHKLPVLTALRKYYKAALWSVLLSTAVVMEGYDLVLLGSFFAQPQFREKYGVYVDEKSGYQISAAWQTGMGDAAACGEIVGLLINAWAADRFGYRRVMLVALAAMVGFIFIVFFANGPGMLVAGEVLCGIPWGIFQVLTTTYAADVCPTVLRPILCAYVNICWVFGQLIGSGVLRGVLDRGDEWAYRIPFAIQWMWPVPLIVGCFFAPESPWWLARHHKIDQARHSLRRLASNPTESEINTSLALIVYTNQLESQRESGSSWLDLFKGVNLRRTEIACITWLIQNWCGSTFSGYTAYFLEQAGMATENSFNLNIGQYCMGAVGTALSWVLMANVGRRTLFIIGDAILFLILIGIGICGSVPNPTDPGPSWAVGALLLVFSFFYDLTVGPLTYPIVAEIPSGSLRTKTVATARALYNITGIVNGVLMPHMLNPLSWNWQAKTGYFWAGLAFLGLIWAYFRLPEPKGRTYAELDILFENKVSARKFSSTVVDPFIATNVPAKQTELDANKNFDTVEHVERA